MRDRDHDEAMAELFRDDPAFAVEVINGILEDGQQDVLMETLRQVAMGSGGLATVAESAKLSQTQLYRTLSAEGNPILSSFLAILKAMGLRLAVQPIDQS